MSFDTERKVDKKNSFIFDPHDGCFFRRVAYFVPTFHEKKANKTKLKYRLMEHPVQ